jgi:hypothetical protein
MAASRLIEYGSEAVGFGRLANCSIIGPYLPNTYCFHSRMICLMGVGPVTVDEGMTVGAIYGRVS